MYIYCICGCFFINYFNQHIFYCRYFYYVDTVGVDPFIHSVDTFNVEAISVHTSFVEPMACFGCRMAEYFTLYEMRHTWSELTYVALLWTVDSTQLA